MENGPRIDALQINMIKHVYLSESCYITKGYAAQKLLFERIHT